MPMFELQTPDGRTFEVDAPDMNGAVQALQGFASVNERMAPAPAPQDVFSAAAEAAGWQGGPKTELPQDMGFTPAEKRAASFGLGAVEGVPIAGPLAMRAGDALAGADEETAAQRKRIADEYSGANLAGQVVGTVAPLAALGSTAIGARALGMTGKSLGGRALNSALSGMAINSADTAARGGDAGDIATSGALGLGFGAAIPMLGAGLKAGYNAIKGGAQRVSGSTTAADDMLARAFAQDKNVGKTLTAADEAVAKQGGAPVYNVDRGGPTVKALARDVANKVPTVWDNIDEVARARFRTQSDRLVNMFSKITGGELDDVAVRTELQRAARKVNKPAYEAAYSQPAARAMWDDQLQRMTSAPAFQEAIRDVERTSRNRAVLEGARAIKNPFVTAPDGTMTLPPGVRPTLEFWDHVKRNLDDLAKPTATRDKATAATYGGMARMLREHLDSLVPEYKAARQGAAAFFGADDAIEAGSKFFSGTRNLNEARKVISSLKPEERKAFAFGFASEAASKAKSLSDSRNALNAMFGSPEAREKLAMTFGKTQAAEIEAFVRVEDALDKTRLALSNSTTAKQLLQAIGVSIGPAGAGAVGGGVLGALATGDVGGAMKGAAAGALVGGSRRGFQRIMAGADEKILREVAEKLMSQDPKVIDALMKRVAASPAHREAVTALGAIAGSLARGGAVASGAALANQD